MDGETECAGDEAYVGGIIGWSVVSGTITRPEHMMTPRRTRRALLIAEKQYASGSIQHLPSPLLQLDAFPTGYRPLLLHALLSIGFKEWHGGECPVPPDSVPYYVMRDGTVNRDGKARDLRWTHENTGPDIVAYWVLGRSVNGFELPDRQWQWQWQWPELWTPEALPAGYRPLLVGEQAEPGDEAARYTKEGWVKVCWVKVCSTNMLEDNPDHRTWRKKPFTSINAGA